MENPLILAVDLGTQSLRAGLVNKKGEIEAISKVCYDPAYISEHKGEAEQDPDFYYDCMVKAIKKLKEEHGDLFNRVIGLSLDTIRDTSVILDENYKPLHRTIIWLDEREASGSMAHRPGWHKVIFGLIGMMPTIKLNLRKSASLWYKENCPEIWRKAKHFGNISSYLTYKITNEFNDSPASIIGHFPLNFKKREFYKKDSDLKNFFGIPLNWLPKLILPGGILGKVTKEFAEATGIKEGLPLYSGGADKSCESLGVGALGPHIAALSYGTASSIEVTTKKYFESEKFLPAYPSCVNGYYNMDVQIYRGYWMINWFLKYFCHLEFKNNEQMIETLNDFNYLMLKIPAGSDGLLLQPYWQPGLARPLARGAIIGFRNIHTSVHFYRAIIEGIAYALREAMEHFEHKTSHHVKQIMISGGGSQSDEICQITANIFGLPVSRVQTFETSLLGAGMAGFLAAKEFNNVEEAVKAMVHISKTFEPNVEEHKLYDKYFYFGYKKIYKRLLPIYKTARRITNNS